MSINSVFSSLRSSLPLNNTTAFSPAAHRPWIVRRNGQKDVNSLSEISDREEFVYSSEPEIVASGLEVGSEEKEQENLRIHFGVPRI